MQPTEATRELAPRDPLTGAYLKSELTDRLKAEVESARLCGTSVSLLVMDLDHFKSVNDAFGHTRGDEVLREFAERLRDTIRSSDVTFRYGGDEFVLLLPDTEREQALTLAHRLLNTIQDAPFSGTPPLNISLSIGSATFPDDVEDADELFQLADAHLYEAKREGRGRVAAEIREPDVRPFAQQSSRLVERDEQLRTIHQFLGALPATKRGTLAVIGPRGSGRSRILSETQKAAQLLGYEVLALRATPALGGRALGTLVDAYPQYELAVADGPDAFGALLAERLQEGARNGLVVTVDDLPFADEATLELLDKLLGDPQLPIVALVWSTGPAGASSRAPHPAAPRTEVQIRPLSPVGLRTWLRTALQWEPPENFLAWLQEQTGGVPARVQAGIARLVELGALSRIEDGWGLDRRFAQLSLGAWLDSRSEVRTSNLPTPTTSLLGRETEIRESKQLLRSGRLLTLFGPGGFGKTRLAVQVAAEMADQSSDGVFYVPLTPVESVGSVVTAIAETLRFSFHTGKDPEDQLAEFLRERQVLLVLDNFEHVVAAAPLVSQLLTRAPHLCVLATSRERLNLTGETVLHVRGMPLPEGDSLAEIQRSAAVQLFAQRARKHRSDLALSDRDWRHIAAICRELGGVPLAIELAAGLVNVLSCGEILTEIRKDLSVLVTSSRDAPDRHRSLRAVFDYSWDLLDEHERAAWMRLSVFPAGFSRAAASEVAGASLPVLAALADKSLLHRTTAGRYAIHEMLRRHAGEKLMERPEQQQNTEAAFVRYFAEFAAQRGQQCRGVDSNKLLAEMAEEVENLRLGFRWAVERGEPVPIEQFAEGLFQFYDSYGWYQEGEENFRWAAERTSDERLQGFLLGRQGHFSSKLGKQDQAKALHRRSIALLRRSGVPTQAALSLYGLGTIAYQEGDYPSAERLLRRCGRLYRTTGSAFGLALCLNDLGNVALMQGRAADAERRFRKSLALRTEINDQAGRARCLTNLGMIADHRGDLGEARRCFEQSLVAARDAADRKSVAAALNNLGVLARRLGEEDAPQLLAEARQFLQEALEVYEEIGSRGGVTLTLYNLGDVACLREEYEASEAYYVEATRRAQALHATSLLTTIVLGAAKLLISTGDRERAVELLFPVLDHPATIDEDRQITRELLTELASLLEPAVFRAAQRTGRRHTLEEVAEAISAGQLRSQPQTPVSLPAPEQSDQTGELVIQASIQQGSTAERAADFERARACY